jgi:methionyl-tRNA formyltransferase
MNYIQKNKIGFLGEGWGAIAAIRSIQKYFIIEYLSKDQDIINELCQDDKVIHTFDEFSYEFILCAGYKSIIPIDVINRFKIINIHYSLLPAYRGFHSTAWAILNGEHNLGLTIHLMNKHIDDGDIIHQKKFVNDKMSSATYYMELMNKYISENSGKIILDFIEGNIKAIKQDKKQASWVGKRGETHNLINFNDTFENCNRLFRVLQPPYPYPSIFYKRKKYYVKRVEYHYSNIITDISRILNVDDDGIWVKSKEGYIILKSITSSEGTDIDKTIFKIGSYLND